MMKKITLILASFSSLFMLALILIFTTPGGSQWAIHYALSLSPQAITVSQITGTLSGDPLTLSGIQYRSKQADIHIDEMSIKWKPYALFKAQLKITDFNMNNISIQQHDIKRLPEKPNNTWADFRSPIAIEIQRAEINHVFLVDAQQKKTPVWSRLDFTATVEQNQLFLESFNITTGQFNASGKGSLTTRSDYPFELESSLEINIHTLPAIDLKIHAKGDLKRLTIDIDAAAPYASNIHARISNPLGPLQWTATLNTELINTQQINNKLEPLSLQGNLNASGDMTSAQTKGQLTVQYKKQQYISTLNADWKRSVLNFEKNTLITEHPKSTLHSKGTISLKKKTSFDVVSQWSNLTLPLKNITPLSSPSGILHVSGNTDAYDFTFASTFKHPTEGVADITMTGYGSQSKIVFPEFSIKQYPDSSHATARGVFKGKGEVSLLPLLSWDIDLVATKLDPGYRWPDFAGQLNFNAALTGTMTENNEVTAHLIIKDVNGTLRQQAVRGYVQIFYNQQSVSFSPFVFSLGENHFVLSGELGDQYNASWKIDAPRLHEFSKDLAGNLFAQGMLLGSTRYPRIHGEAKSSHLRFQDKKIGSLDSEFDINLRDQSQSHSWLTLKNLSNAQNSIDSLTASLNGTAKDHKFKLHIEKNDNVLKSTFQGQYQDHSWQGTITDTVFASAQYGHWQAKPSALNLSKNAIKLSTWCWLQNKEAQICFNADWKSNQAFSALVDAQTIPLSLLQKSVQNDIKLKGYIDLYGEFSQTEQAPMQGKLSLQSTQGRLDFKSNSEPILNLNYRDALFELTINENIAKMSSSLKVGKQGHITTKSEFIIDDFSTLDWRNVPGKGVINLHLDEIDYLPKFVPEIGESVGILNAQINYAGTLKQPQLDARISLGKNGRIFLISPGITLQNISFQATSNTLEQVEYQLQLNSGPGHIEIIGKLQQNQARQWQTTFNVKGEQFKILNLPEYEALISPDINVELTKEAVDINGVLVVPYARLEPTDLSNAVAISPDVEIVSSQNQNTQSSLPEVSAAVRIKLGNDIKFKGFGLEAEIHGTAVIMDSPDQLTSSIGELRLVKGKFKAYGQDLTIDRGRFIFVGGPIGDPGLDIRASRQPKKDIRVGVNVQGSLSEPELSLFSEPPMDHTDALSYLLLGRSMREKGSQKEGKLMLKAANQLGLAGGSLLSKTISKHFGIDDIRIDNIGDTFDPTLVIRQVLSNKWSIEASRSRKDYGTDLLYSIDKN